MAFDWYEWLNILVRWTHVFAGILWIGTTYFFTWLDGRFHELMRAGTEASADPNVWMVHSGGFYVVGKQSEPAMLATKLYWFKWEAAITWLSGILLLVIVYYTGGLMYDSRYDETTSITVGLGSFVIAWFVYDTLWNSKLGHRPRVAVAISFVLSVVAIYVYTQLYGGRAAFIHAGGMFGTIMTANVWMRIIPAQRKMVAALQEDKPVDLALGERAKTRSKHNTYMIVPVVFTMISNHYPTSTYGDTSNWLVLTVLVLLGWIAAHFLRRA